MVEELLQDSFEVKDEFKDWDEVVRFVCREISIYHRKLYELCEDFVSASDDEKKGLAEDFGLLIGGVNGE